MQRDSLTSLLKKHNLWADKSLGQHFLHDNNICQRIVKHLNLDGKVAVEIGPGPGSLTYVLNNLPLKYLLAIEKDSKFKNVLNEITKDNKNFYLKEADALKTNIKESLKELGINDKYNIVANLPYNIGTELLINWCYEIDNIESITVMLQKEVVDRIKAKYGTKDYGRLSVIMQSCFSTQELFKIPPSAFIPPPKVLSSVIFLKPLINLPNKELLNTISKITHMAFSKRRKMIKSSLGKDLPANLWQSICEKTKIDETIRPEQIKPEIFFEMADICKNQI